MSIPQRAGAYLAVLLIMTTVVAVGGFICPASGPVTPATKGPIFVNIGFGAVATPPYDCTGSGTVTVTPQNLTGTEGNGQEQSQNYTFSGKSSTVPNEPACQMTVNFPDKTPGTWLVSNGQASCPKTLTAGQPATVKIWNGVCQ
ncbi:MAG TPA: hypothetical protein VH680_03635 [Gemmatimonadales bacterium]|jgi:hypothetical protein